MADDDFENFDFDLCEISIPNAEAPNALIQNNAVENNKTGNDELEHMQQNRLLEKKKNAPIQKISEFNPNLHRKPFNIESLSNYQTIITKECGFAAGARLNIKELQTWNFILSKEFREYQFKMVESCLFFNTLVGLPTGLGKTFIAVNVMYNYYRWFQDGIIFFLAPTRPLVAQQLQACIENDVFNKNDLKELTGETSGAIRKKIYTEGRIFFMTPQTLENDLQCERLNTDKIVLVIYDEAHRASGSYSYCEIQKELSKKESGVRIVALTATPGNDLEQVKEVIVNLSISKMFIKDENDEDVERYVHSKSIKIIQVASSDLITSIESKLGEIQLRLAKILEDCLVRPEDTKKVPKNLQAMKYETFKKLQESFQHNQSEYFTLVGPDIMSRVWECFSIMFSFIHVRKALVEQGIESFKKALFNFQNKLLKKNGSVNVLKKELLAWPHFQFIVQNIKDVVKPIHPKMLHIQALLDEFFREKKNGSRVIIFTQSRSTASEITGFLKANCECVKPSLFVGQSTSDGQKGMKQHEQINLIKTFKRGDINTLVATCVAEEGLDIGEVDLIICYDSGLSPIRLVQRMGRTGRKREGFVYLLLMEKEYYTYIASETQRKKLNAQLKGLCENNILTATIKANILPFYCYNPRMVPEEIQPKLVLFDKRPKDFIVEDAASDNDNYQEESNFLGNELAVNAQLQSCPNSKSDVFSSSFHEFDDFRMDSVMDSKTNQFTITNDLENTCLEATINTNTENFVSKGELENTKTCINSKSVLNTNPPPLKELAENHSIPLASKQNIFAAQFSKNINDNQLNPSKPEGATSFSNFLSLIHSSEKSSVSSKKLNQKIVFPQNDIPKIMSGNKITDFDSNKSLVNFDKKIENPMLRTGNTSQESSYYTPSSSTVLKTGKSSDTLQQAIKKNNNLGIEKPSIPKDFISNLNNQLQNSNSQLIKNDMKNLNVPKLENNKLSVEKKSYKEDEDYLKMEARTESKTATELRDDFYNKENKLNLNTVMEPIIDQSLDMIDFTQLNDILSPLGCASQKRLIEGSLSKKASLKKIKAEESCVQNDFNIFDFDVDLLQELEN